jgi:hypothetical protein
LRCEGQGVQDGLLRLLLRRSRQLGLFVVLGLRLQVSGLQVNTPHANRFTLMVLPAAAPMPVGGTWISASLLFIFPYDY